MSDWMNEPPMEPGWYYERTVFLDDPNNPVIRVVEFVRWKPKEERDPLSGIMYRTFGTTFYGEGNMTRRVRKAWFGPLPAPPEVPPIPFLPHA